MHNFRKLKVYEKGLILTKKVRETTRKFPIACSLQIAVFCLLAADCNLFTDN